MVNSKYEFIDGEKDNYPIVKMCLWSEVSKSGFYEWRNRPESATTQRRGELGDLIILIFIDSDETYGYRRVWHELGRQGVSCGAELVRAIMRAKGLVACQPRPWRQTTIPDDAALSTPDLVKRDFGATAPGRKLVGDITYIATWEGFIYLATVIDCYTKMVVGYAIADHMKASLVCDAIAMAGRKMVLEKKAIFHSDYAEVLVKPRNSDLACAA